MGVAGLLAIHGNHKYDVAVAKLLPEEKLPFLDLDDSNLVNEGDHALACGFPLGPYLQPKFPVGSLFLRGIISGIRPHSVSEERNCF
jgi:S1-C subfamily serine protease